MTKEERNAYMRKYMKDYRKKHPERARIWDRNKAMKTRRDFDKVTMDILNGLGK